MFRVGVRDTQCGFKMMRGDIARSLFQSTQEKGYLIDLELLLLARDRGCRIVETPVVWREMPGSKLCLWKVAIPVATDLWKLYRRLRRLRKSSDASSRTCGGSGMAPGRYTLNKHRPRRAVTLIEVLVAISIFGLLVSLLIPAVVAARASARRSQCQSQVHEIAQAVMSHESVHRHYPTGGWTYTWVGDPDRGFGPGQPGGWIYNILPYIEEQSLRELGKNAVPTDRASALAKLCQTPIAILVCPDRALARLTPYAAELPPRNAVHVPRVAKSYYAINAGDWEFGGLGPGPQTFEEADRRTFDWPDPSRASGISYQRSSVRTAQILDGTSKTYLVGEKYVYPQGSDIGHDQSMYTGYDYDVCRWTNTGLAPYGQGNVRSFGSSHAAGAHFAFADGSVHMIRFGIHLRVHQALGNRHDGSEVALPLD
jgi:prepilin-type N-terminal cleavage/methylation domain-containing protein